MTTATTPTLRPLHLVSEQPPRRSALDLVMAQGSLLITGLPRWAKRLIAGRPIRIQGDELELETQLALRAQALITRHDGPTPKSPQAARSRLARLTRWLPERSRRPVARAALRLPGPSGSIPARLYTPEGLAAGSPLLVYYHGGGWTVGSLDTHDGLCAHLSGAAGIRVLSVDYRLAPEHPFPAAVEDADAAYRFAREHAEELGADPERIAVGGDSAGGTLATVVCQQSTGENRTAPDFGLLIYPAGDMIEQTESRRLFETGFFLDKPLIEWFSDCYCPSQLRDDPRSSPLRAPDGVGLPPVYIATAAFDPLRDEGEALAAKFAAAGAKVTLRRHRGLVHGFANFAAISPGSMAAVSEMVGALRTALDVPAGA